MVKTPNRPRFMTVSEVAAAIRCSDRSVWRMVQRGELQPTRFGRLTRFAPEALHRIGVVTE